MLLILMADFEKKISKSFLSSNQSHTLFREQLVSLSIDKTPCVFTVKIQCG